MSEAHKVYIPAGQWIVTSLTSYCQAHGIGNASIVGIGSITNVWVMLDPAGKPIVRNFSTGPSYEMTSLIGNVTLRQGLAQFDPSGLLTGAYPQMDSSVQTFNAYVHAHVTFANADMSISGGHLLDAQASIEAEIVLRTMAGPLCVPGITADQIPADCVSDVSVTVEPYGTFSNWSQSFWYPPPAKPAGDKS
jgi:predicted DNA-binding protein with PD1-like motif